MEVRISAEVPEFHQTEREFFEETKSNHHGMNPPDLSCLRLDPPPFWLTLAPLPWSLLWYQRAWRRTPLVRRNDSSTCCGRNVMGQTVRSSPPGSLGIQAPVKIPLVFKCICRRVEWRMGRRVICLSCRWQRPYLVPVNLPSGSSHLFGVQQL